MGCSGAVWNGLGRCGMGLNVFRLECMVAWVRGGVRDGSRRVWCEVALGKDGVKIC